jgi:N-methylhydantoinase A
MDDDGRLTAFKAPTTAADPSQGLVDAFTKAARAAGEPLDTFVATCSSIIHGTTLATNALLTGHGAKVGMLTTRGFRDQVEARRGQKNVRTSMYNLFVPPYRALVPRSRRLPISERILKDGSVATPLDTADAQSAIERLAKEGVESIAICLLHSYANGEHERRVKELCREHYDGSPYLTTSHEVVPIWGEYERFSTTLVDAYVGPVVAGYVARLEERLASLGFSGTLLMVQSDGLTQSAAASRLRAVGLVNSGPAAAPTSARHWGRLVGHDNLISIDMGGTSFDVCLIQDGQIPNTVEGWVGDERISIKMVDNLTVGAGGGSIVWIDDFGLLRIGPRSSGADPGPASYGRGGIEPTVTDADVVLGYIPTDYFLGGEIQLEANRASEALLTVAEQLHLDDVHVAEAIFTTANSFMADQITEISTRRGLDIRDFALVVGGGAGPVHAASMADILGIPAVIVPRYSALYSAFGMFTMDLGREYVRSYLVGIPDVDLAELGRLYTEMEREAIEDLGTSHIDPREITITRTADMRYAGQYHAVEVALPDLPRCPEDVDNAVSAFQTRHRELYTFDLPFRTAEFMVLRLKASVGQPPIRMPSLPTSDSTGSPGVVRTRKCFLTGRWVETNCYAGTRLRAGDVIHGPALIEETTTTVLVPGGFVCKVHPAGAFVLSREEVRGGR